MSSLSVTLATTPPQQLLGFNDSYPLQSQSVAKLTPLTSNPNLPTVSKWLGITFGTAQRWDRPSAYVDESNSVKECFEFGSFPLQTKKSALEYLWIHKQGWVTRSHIKADEDCLNLNVYVPEAAARKAEEEGRKLPVMTWTYGGAAATGQADAIRHDATELVRLAEKEGNPVIVVTGNYRVNIFGFLSHSDLAEADPEGLCGNYGFYDQLLMLEWIQSHIHHFGGDKNEVTAFGESAGAWSISALAARANPTHLFKRTILQSGSPSTMSFRAPAYSPWSLLLSQFNLSSPSLTAKERVEGLRKVPAEEILEFSMKNSMGSFWGGTLQEGGIWGMKEPEKRYLDGEWEKGISEWVLGVNEHEGSLFVGALGGALETPAGFEKFIQRFPSPAVVQSLYPESSTSTPILDGPAALLLGDMMFYAPLDSLAISLATAVKNPPTIRQFSFNAALPDMSGDLGIGNHHGIEIPFIFGTRTFWPVGSAEEKTSEECMRRWSSLANGQSGKGLGPTWDAWTVETPMKLIIGPGGGETKIEKEVLSELEESRKKFWLQRFRSQGETGGAKI